MQKCKSEQRPVEKWKGERGRRPREDRVQSTDYGARKDAETVQRCKSERSSGAKVER